MRRGVLGGVTLAPQSEPAMGRGKSTNEAFLLLGRGCMASSCRISEQDAFNASSANLLNTDDSNTCATSHFHVCLRIHKGLNSCFPLGATLVKIGSHQRQHADLQDHRKHEEFPQTKC